MSPLVDLLVQENRHIENCGNEKTERDWFRRRFSESDFSFFSLDGLVQSLQKSSLEVHLRQGLNDEVCPVSATKEFYETANDFGLKVKLDLVPNVGHAASNYEEEFRQAERILKGFRNLPDIR